MKNQTVTLALELLEGLGGVRARAMFGGWGLYCDDLFFALITNDTLYFKADDQSRAIWEAAGSAPFVFQPKNGEAIQMSYYRAPDEVWDDAGEMARWGKLGFEAAQRAAKVAKPKTSRPKTGKRSASQSSSGASARAKSASGSSNSS